MKIEVDEQGQLRIKEVYGNTYLETREGNRLYICMRDDTFEMSPLHRRVSANNWWRVNMGSGRIEEMRGTQPTPLNPLCGGREQCVFHYCDKEFGKAICGVDVGTANLIQGAVGAKVIHKFIGDSAETTCEHCKKLLIKEGKLIYSGGAWDEDLGWTRSEWMDDVTAGDTQLGYWEWVAHNRESVRHEHEENCSGCTGCSE